MKILFVLTGLGIGGAEKQVVELADEFSSRGHKVVIAYLTGTALLMPSDKLVEVVPLYVNKNIFSVCYGVKNLIALLNTFKPEVVHSHMFHANLLSRFARLFVKMPRLVCTAHSNNEGGRLRMFAYRVTESLADISTNVSIQAVKDFEKKGAASKNRMIPVVNGINVDKFKFDPVKRACIRSIYNVQEKKVVLAVGRLSEAKDYPNLLNAFALTLKSENNAILWIVGDGELRGSLNSLAINLGISESVVFFGIRHDIPDMMFAADVFVLSSAWEGFGLVVAEAMSSERVVVATDCGGVKEVVGDAGYLVPPSDSPALSSGMCKALKVSDNKLGEMARLRVKSLYSFDCVISNWLKIYSSEYV